MNETEEIQYEIGSDNIYDDLGLPDADLLLAKSEAVIQILKVIESRGWSREEFADRIGIGREVVDTFYRGSAGDLSLDDLVRIAGRLGKGIRLVVIDPVSVSIPTPA